MSGCFSNDSQIAYSAAEKLTTEKKYKQAVQELDKIIKRFRGDDVAIRAANRAAEILIYQLKDHKKSISYLKYLVLSSRSHEERRKAQEKIAEFNLTYLSDFDQAIIEFGRLEEITRKKSEKNRIRLKLAKAYYFKKNFFQAKTEIDRLLKNEELEKSLRYQALFLKANVKMTEKKTNLAIEIFSQLLDIYPQRAEEDNVGLYLAICYEEIENFPAAISSLEKMKISFRQKDYLPEKTIRELESLKYQYRDSSFIDEKIKKLRVRQTFLPGAKGLRK